MFLQQTLLPGSRQGSTQSPGPGVPFPYLARVPVVVGGAVDFDEVNRIESKANPKTLRSVSQEDAGWHGQSRWTTWSLTW